jgi:hypothetical protein
MALAIMARRALSPSTPARQRRAPFAGFGGLTAQHGQASGVSCQECREAPSEGRPVQTAISETWVIILGPKGLSSGCSVLCSRSI